MKKWLVWLKISQKNLKVIKLQKMVPIEKVKSIVTTYESLEKELASGSLDNKVFVTSTLPAVQWIIYLNAVYLRRAIDQ